MTGWAAFEPVVKYFWLINFDLLGGLSLAESLEEMDRMEGEDKN